MKSLSSLVLLLMLVFCLPAQASEPDLTMELIPQPEWRVCGEQSCMTFEATQNLVRMRSHYVTLFELVPKLREEADLWKSTAESALQAVDNSYVAYQQLFTVYTETNTELLTQIEARESAEKFSIIDGALPWVITSAAVIFVGGIYLGAQL